LKIDGSTSKEFEKVVLEGCEAIKPGWVRVNFNYFISETVFDYIIRAVDFVATEGWKLLPLYRFDAATGRWWHCSGPPEPPMSLHDVSYSSAGMEYRSRIETEAESALGDYLAKAREIVEDAVATYPTVDPDPTSDAEMAQRHERLRWFVLPHEALRELHGRPQAPPAAGLLGS
jgi:hypothetical protein